MGVAKEEDTSRQEGEEDPLVEEARGRDEGGSREAGELGGSVPDGKGQGQPACQKKWKNSEEENE